MILLNDHQLNIFKEAFYRVLYHVVIDDKTCAEPEKFKKVLTELFLNYNLEIPEPEKYERRIMEHGIISCFLTLDEAKVIAKLPYVVGVESEKFANIEN